MARKIAPTTAVSVRGNPVPSSYSPLSGRWRDNQYSTLSTSVTYTKSVSRSTDEPSSQTYLRTVAYPSRIMSRQKRCMSESISSPPYTSPSAQIKWNGGFLYCFRTHSAN